MLPKRKNIYTSYPSTWTKISSRIIRIDSCLETLKSKSSNLLFKIGNNFAAKIIRFSFEQNFIKFFINCIIQIETVTWHWGPIIMPHRSIRLSIRLIRLLSGLFGIKILVGSKWTVQSNMFNLRSSASTWRISTRSSAKHYGFSICLSGRLYP